MSDETVILTYEITPILKVQDMLKTDIKLMNAVVSLDDIKHDKLYKESIARMKIRENSENNKNPENHRIVDLESKKDYSDSENDSDGESNHSINKKQDSGNENDNSEKWIECEIEPDKIERLEQLLAEHEGRALCNICKKGEPTKYHFMRHLNIRRFKCTTCGERFRTKSNHDESRADRTKEQVLCGECHDCFPTKRKLLNHMRAKHPEKCEEPQRRKTSGKSSKKERHSNEKPFSCSTCGKKFASRVAWKGHLATHSEERPFECHQCPGKFKLLKTLKKHMAVHATENTHFCKHCGAGFKRQEAMRHHVLRKHANPNPFVCTICDHRTITQALLNSHLKQHDKSKTYTCSICSKSFPLKTSLSTHMRMVHSEKEHTCSVCDKTFKSKPYLRLHMKRHEHKKYYTCICGNKYKGKIALRDHAIVNNHWAV